MPWGVPPNPRDRLADGPRLGTGNLQSARNRRCGIPRQRPAEQRSNPAEREQENRCPRDAEAYQCLERQPAFRVRQMKKCDEPRHDLR